MVRREGCGVGACVGWDGKEGGFACGGPLWQRPLVETGRRLQKERAYNFDSAVPGTGAERVLRYQIPMYCKDFSVMLLPAPNWEFV